MHLYGIYSCGMTVDLDSPYILKRGTPHLRSHDPRRFDRLTISPDRIYLGECTLSRANYTFITSLQNKPWTRVSALFALVCIPAVSTILSSLLTSQARYGGLCNVMYVSACYNTDGLMPDRFASIFALCMFTP